MRSCSTCAIFQGHYTAGEAECGRSQVVARSRQICELTPSAQPTTLADQHWHTTRLVKEGGLSRSGFVAKSLWAFLASQVAGRSKPSTSRSSARDDNYSGPSFPTSYLGRTSPRPFVSHRSISFAVYSFVTFHQTFLLPFCTWSACSGRLC